MTNIEMPRDAEGREIPLDTNVLYDKDGERLAIYAWEYRSKLKCFKWTVHFLFDESGDTCYPDEYFLTPPDSWEKLLEDLDNVAKGGDNAECCYMRREDIEVGDQCSGCRLYNADDVFSDCSLLAYADIAARIRKLAAKESE